MKHCRNIVCPNLARKKHYLLALILWSIKINGKIFLLAGLDQDPLQFNVKCDPDKVQELREEHPCVLPGYHMNKKHWNTIVIDGSVSNAQLKEWIDWSYDLVKGKARSKK